MSSRRTGSFNKRLLAPFALFALLFSGCTSSSNGIALSQPAFGILSIAAPSLSFYTPEGDPLVSWPLDAGYTGFVFIGQDLVLLYGQELKAARLIRLSTAETVRDIALPKGIANCYAAPDGRAFYAANKKDGTVSKYAVDGRRQALIRTGSYPLSLASDGKRLFAADFAGRSIDVLALDSLRRLDRWPVRIASMGLYWHEKRGELWVGGRGTPAAPNSYVEIRDGRTGGLKRTIQAGQLPIAFAAGPDRAVYAVSQGSGEVHLFSETGALIQKFATGSNPFALASLSKSAVAAGYDDSTLYFLQAGAAPVERRVPKGPFAAAARPASH